MVKISRIYKNPLSIAEGHYHVRIGKRELGYCNGKDVLQVQFTIVACPPPCAGVKLWCNLYLTPDAHYLFDLFMRSFQLEAGLAMFGRHAKIKVRHTTYKGTSYSEVRFCEQTDLDRTQSAELNEDFRKKLIEEEKARRKQKKPKRELPPDIFEDME